jgi:hypothetical protein
LGSRNNCVGELVTDGVGGEHSFLILKFLKCIIIRIGVSVIPGETEGLSFLSESLGFMVFIVQSIQAESNVGEISGVGVLKIGSGAVGGGVAIGKGHSCVSSIGGVGTSYGNDGIIIIFILLNIIGDDWEGVSNSILEVGLELIHGVSLDELTQIDGVENGTWVGEGNNFSGGSVDSG